MKYLFSILIITTILSSHAQTLKPGDNVWTEFNKISKPYYFEAPDFTSWKEGDKMLLIGNNPNPDDCDFVFLALKDTTIIGVFNNKTPNIFMFDTKGDSILGNNSKYFLLPLWSVKNNTTIDSSDKKILFLLNKMYDKTLQGNDFVLDEATLKAYRKYQTSKALANRHIALLFDNYQTLISETATKGKQPPSDICISLMKSLTEEFQLLYDTVPAIVYIYMGEALLSAGMIDEARVHFKESLNSYPNSIPLKVYNYRLEQDNKKKKKRLAELKKKHGKHWMVKDL